MASVAERGAGRLLGGERLQQSLVAGARARNGRYPCSLLRRGDLGQVSLHPCVSVK